MAYLRYGLDSEWYVFWYSDKAEAEREEGAGSRVPKDETRLAVAESWNLLASFAASRAACT
jgi:hypothetical protein